MTITQAVDYMRQARKSRGTVLLHARDHFNRVIPMMRKMEWPTDTTQIRLAIVTRELRRRKLIR